MLSIRENLTRSLDTFNSLPRYAQPQAITAAQRLLVCVSRPFLDADSKERVLRLLRAGVDWDYLTRTAERHGVGPLLHFHLSKISNAEVPPDVISFFEREAQRNTSRALLLTGELIKLLSAFERHGIEAIPWKGPTLAAVAYRDLALREFVDLDLFVCKKDMPRVNEILSEAGFAPSPEITKPFEAALLRFDCARNFVSDGIFADVHWACSPLHLALTLQLDMDRLQPVSLGPQHTTTLSQEDLLLALSIHGLTHYWERLAWVADVGALIALKQIDWRALTTKARRSGLFRIAAVAVLLARDLLDVSLPFEISEPLEADRFAVELARMFGSAMFDQQRRSQSTISIIKLHLKIRERWRDKLLTLARFTLTPRLADLEAVRLPPQLNTLYYVVRPMRLIYKYASTFARRLFGASPS